MCDKNITGVKSAYVFDFENDKNMRHNLRVAERYGKVVYINTGYMACLARHIMTFPNSVAFYDQNGDKRIIQYSDILNFKVGVDEACIAYA